LHGVATPATPTTQAFGDAATSGAGTGFSTDTHKHAMPATPSVNNTVLSGSIDSAGSGTQAITGTGFTPQSLLVIVWFDGAQSASDYGSICFVNSSRTIAGMKFTGNWGSLDNVTTIVADSDAANAMDLILTVTSYDADGFTVTKSSTAGSNITAYRYLVIAFR
jgi:hypothetical protein